MAYCISSQVTSTAPQIRMNVDLTSQTDTTATLSWGVYYVASSPASTSVSKAYRASIAGNQVTSGSYSINGKVGEYLIASGTKKITKTTAAQTISFSVAMDMNLTWSGNKVNTVSATGSISVPAKTLHTITYNRNGASGSSFTVKQYHGEALTISAAISRTGYTFKGWGTTSSGGTIYQPGNDIKPTASITLYAIWQANTYTITYDANGGTGAPSNQTKTYGVTLKLSSTIPKRTNYNFKGWGTSSTTTTVAYTPGSNYTNNAGDTLYAIWELAYTKPRIDISNIVNCDANGIPNNNGTYGCVSFHFECDRSVKSIEVRWESETAGSGSTLADISNLGNVIAETTSVVFGDGLLSTESTYTISVIVTDEVGYSYAFGTLAGTKFVIDFKAGGTGAAFGKPAELDGVLDIMFQTRHSGGLLPLILEPETDLNEIMIPNTYVGANVSTNKYICGDESLPITSGTFSLEVVAMGEEGQRKQRLTYCAKGAARTWERIYYSSSWGDWVCVSDFDGQLLWSGVYYMNDTQTAPLAEPISKQRSGIVLVFSRYSGGVAQNYHFNTFFVPKYQVQTHAGCGHTFMMTTDASFSVFAAKYLYINDESIVGNANNESSGTGSCGIKYSNEGFVLRYVIGV